MKCLTVREKIAAALVYARSETRDERNARLTALLGKDVYKPEHYSQFASHLRSCATGEVISLGPIKSHHGAAE